MKIYYAHHLYKYNTQIEEYELELIKKYFSDSEIINPNGYINQENTDEYIMKECLKTIEECDSIIFSDMNGVVGRGVYREINKAIRNEKHVFYIKQNAILRVIDIEWNIIDENNRIYAIPIIKASVPVH